METENSLVVHSSIVPSLDRETTERIVKDAEAARLFAKATDTGEFKIGEDLVKIIIGRVLEVDRYAGHWEAGEMAKLRNFEDPEDLPEGYDLRADVTILTPDLQTVTISLPSSSYRFHFANQVKRLTAAGKNITDCLCEFSVKTVKGKKGIFPVVITKVLEPMTTRPVKPDLVQESLDRDIIKDSDIPF